MVWCGEMLGRWARTLFVSEVRREPGVDGLQEEVRVAVARGVEHPVRELERRGRQRRGCWIWRCGVGRDLAAPQIPVSACVGCAVRVCGGHLLSSWWLGERVLRAWVAWGWSLEWGGGGRG